MSQIDFLYSQVKQNLHGLVKYSYEAQYGLYPKNLCNIDNGGKKLNKFNCCPISLFRTSYSFWQLIFISSTFIISLLRLPRLAAFQITSQTF